MNITYFWPCWVFVTARGYFLVAVLRLFCSGFSCCRAQAPGAGSVAVACGLSYSMAGMSYSLDQGCSPDPCVGRQILNHWTTKFSSVQSLSRVWLFATPCTAARQASLSITNSNSCPSSQWCHPTVSSSGIPFSSCPQSFPASGPFPVSQFVASGGQSVGVSASFLPMNIQAWFPLGLTGWMILQSKGLSRVFSNTTVQKHQFFGTQLSV